MDRECVILNDYAELSSERLLDPSWKLAKLQVVIIGGFDYTSLGLDCHLPYSLEVLKQIEKRNSRANHCRYKS